MSTVILKKQPRGLWILSICELFGRFSYYGLQSSFILYLTKVFLFTDQRSYVLFGLFSALAFCFPILGGWIGDRYLGRRHAIVLGLMINVVGNLLLMVQNLYVFYLGVALFITGISLFKSNSATLLGRLYQEQDTRQEPGFTVLYAFMNIGSILGPICYGIVITQYGWRIGFLLGAIVELSSLILIFWNRNYFQKTLATIKRQDLNLQGASPYLILLLLITTMIIFAFLTFPSAFKIFFWLLSLCVLSFIIYLASRLKSKARSAIFLLVLLEIFAIFYFACEIQVGSSLTLFISDCVHYFIGSWHVPTQTYNALEPIFFILLTPLFNVLWKHAGRSYAFPVFRISLGLLFGAVSFVLFAMSANVAVQSTGMAVFWLVIGNLFLGAGELCIGPTMISAVTRLAPAKWQGTFMGIWWFAISFSYYIGNLFISGLMVHHQNMAMSKDAAYQNAFSDLSIIIFSAFVVLVCLGILYKCLWGKKDKYLLE